MRVDRRRSRPSEKFGTDSSGSTLRTLGPCRSTTTGARPNTTTGTSAAGLFAERDRPGWEDELARLVQALVALPRERTLDVACGTGFLTRHLRGDVTGLDQSEAMLAEARRQATRAVYVQGDALSLPFPDDSFDRIFTAHFYGHLERSERDMFSAEARRVARELVVVDSARAGADQDDARQERTLNDGSRLAGLQALVHGGRARRRARRRRDALRRHAGSSPSARHDASSLVLPLARLARARPARLPRLRRGRASRSSRCPCSRRVHGQRAYLYGQAPGVQEGLERRPWRGRAGRRCAAGSTSTRTRSTRPSTAPRSHAATRARRRRAAATGRRRPRSRRSAPSGASRSWRSCGRGSSSPSAGSRRSTCSGLGRVTECVGKQL